MEREFRLFRELGRPSRELPLTSQYTPIRVGGPGSALEGNRPESAGRDTELIFSRAFFMAARPMRISSGFRSSLPRVTGLAYRRLRWCTRISASPCCDGQPITGPRAWLISGGGGYPGRGWHSGQQRRPSRGCLAGGDGAGLRGPIRMPSGCSPARSASAAASAVPCHAHWPRGKISQPSRCWRMTAGTRRFQAAALARARSCSPASARVTGLLLRGSARPGRLDFGQPPESAQQAQRG